MSECMPIPDNWKDFVKEYSFKDIKEIYTNGSWLIPTFRVEQMMEHFAKPEWISVKDKLPKKDGDYIVYGEWGSGKKYMDIVDFAVHDGYFRTVWNFDVTHWMPLPEPPKE